MDLEIPGQRAKMNPRSRFAGKMEQLQVKREGTEKRRQGWLRGRKKKRRNRGKPKEGISTIKTGVFYMVGGERAASEKNERGKWGGAAWPKYCWGKENLVTGNQLCRKRNTPQKS